VPKNLWTAEICLEAVKLKAADSFPFDKVPDNAKTAEACFEVVRQHEGGRYLKYVPENLMTAELCLEAVKNLTSPPSHLYPDWDRFAIVPEKLREEVRRRYENGE